MLATNRLRLETVSESSSSRAWFDSVRAAARQEAVELAIAYTRRYAEDFAAEMAADADDWLRPFHPDEPLIVGGHQPELFHPGVWFKNFVLSEVSELGRRRSLHVIIDHDLAKSDALRVPTIDASSESLGNLSVRIPLRNEDEPRLPWHATLGKTNDLRAWQRVSEQMESLLASSGSARPLLAEYASTIDREVTSGLNMAEALSRFRHRIELKHGLRNLEVPISHLCNSSAFASFLHRCLVDAKELHRIYNRRRAEYRQTNRIRNQAQPVLELEQRIEWLELPFWLYSTDKPNRQRLWVHLDTDVLTVCQSPSNSEGISLQLPRDPREFQQALQRHIENGLCVRPRALMTTMYLRCFVADLFLHGIGGGAYDRLTDGIIADFLQIEPPRYMITSASLHLPMTVTSDLAGNEIDELESNTRRRSQLLRSRPELFLDRTDQEQASLWNEHSQLLDALPPLGSRKGWRQQMISLKRRIRSAIQSTVHAIGEQTKRWSKAHQQKQIATSREYSFVLFDEQDVVSRLRQLAKESIETPRETCGAA